MFLLQTRTNISSDNRTARGGAIKRRFTSDAKSFLVSKPMVAWPTPSWDWITFAWDGHGESGRGAGDGGQRASYHGKPVTLNPNIAYRIARYRITKKTHLNENQPIRTSQNKAKHMKRREAWPIKTLRCQYKNSHKSIYKFCSTNQIYFLVI